MSRGLVKADPVIAKLQTARDALASATTPRAAKRIVDVAAAAEVYARRQQLGEESIGFAHAVKTEALARLGELLEATPRATGGQPYQATSSNREPVERTPTLAHLGIDKKVAMVAQQLAGLPTAVQRAIAARQTTLKQARRQAQRQAKVERAQVAAAHDVPNAELRVTSMTDLLSTLSDLDAIITDPPYGADAVPLYGSLAEHAKRALAPHGVLLVMCGQSYLPEILTAMVAHMPYRWTLAYLTPGGQAPQIWPRKVNTFWKPVLLFGASPGWIGDVIRSDVNDNDKRFHDWGQSESGMARLVEALTEPGHRICDPFLGAGTTGVVARRLGRRFIGGDLDPETVALAKARLADD